MSCEAVKSLLCKQTASQCFQKLEVVAKDGDQVSMVRGIDNQKV